MNENEMTGMAAPMGDEMMEDTAEPMASDMPVEDATAGVQPEVAESKFDMEMLMGNFMDLPDERRKMATRLLASPAAAIFDEIVGEPVMQRLITQLDMPVPAGAQAEEESTGMMSPTEDMPESPMGAPDMEEEATPPV